MTTQTDSSGVVAALILGTLAVVAVVVALVLFWKYVVLILFGLVVMPFVWGALKGAARL